MFFKRGEIIGGASYFYGKDHLGSVRIITDSTGSIKALYDFDAFGNQSSSLELVPGDYRYAGYYFHSRSGLDLTANRIYNPVLAVWLSRDPAVERSNPYNYVDGNPFSRIDPSGLDYANVIIAGPHVGLLVNVQQNANDEGTFYMINGYFASSSETSTGLKLIVFVDETEERPNIPWVVKGTIPALMGPEVKSTCPGGLQKLVDSAKRLKNKYNSHDYGYAPWPGHFFTPRDYGTSNQVTYSLLKNNQLPIPSIATPAPGYNLDPIGLPNGYYW